MSTHYFNKSIINLANIYYYDGYTFEFHQYLGPFLCKKDGEPRVRQPGNKSRFWAVLDCWLKLSKEAKELTRIYG